MKGSKVYYKVRPGCPCLLPQRPTPGAWQVKSILDRRLNANGLYEYKVRWQGYTEKDDTWEARTLRDKPRGHPPLLQPAHGGC